MEMGGGEHINLQYVTCLSVKQMYLTPVAGGTEQTKTIHGSCWSSLMRLMHSASWASLITSLTHTHTHNAHHHTLASPRCFCHTLSHTGWGREQGQCPASRMCSRWVVLKHSWRYTLYCAAVQWIHNHKHSVINKTGVCSHCVIWAAEEMTGELCVMVFVRVV